MPDLSSLKRTRLRGTTSRVVAALAAASAMGVAGLATIPAAASASTHQITIIQDSSDLSNSPAATAGALAQFRALGATTVRVIINWATIAPNAKRKSAPKHFNASDPAAYRAALWTPYDNLDRAAKTYGLTVDFVVSGGAPRWAEGPGSPHNYVGNPFFAWKPNAADYGQFFKAVATRYDGRYKPKGQSSPLPDVHFWSIYNEPNFGEDLGPQAIKGSSVTYAPRMYRSLVNAGWRALQQTGHRHDTVLIGSFAAMGSDMHAPTSFWPQGLPGNSGQTHPIQFVRSLYCLNANSGRKLSGAAASAEGCPVSAKAKSKFRAQNPGLFGATGVDDHPYPSNGSPLSLRGPDFATFPELGHLARTVDAGTRAWHGGRSYKIYNDEFGWITNPPNNNPKRRYVSPAKAAFYMNWAEYLSWRNPVVASYDQYLLRDPSGHYPFSSGLETPSGAKKPGYNAFRMPLYMPKTSFSHKQAVTVWGEARPAHYGKGPQTVAIQFQAKGKGSWKTVRTVKSSTYFSVKQRFTGSGDVRIAYRYPKSDQLLPPGYAGHLIVGRSQKITVH
jgi:hypothetical protein